MIGGTKDPTAFFLQQLLRPNGLADVRIPKEKRLQVIAVHGIKIEFNRPQILEGSRGVSP